MSADVEPYDPGLPASLGDWTYDDYVRVWHEVESRSAWARADLAAAVPEGQLRQFGTDVGTAYQTVKNYRAVAAAWPAGTRPHIPFGVAAALAAHPHRFGLARQHPDMTVRKARELAAPEKPGKIGGGQPAVPEKPPEQVAGTVNQTAEKPQPVQVKAAEAENTAETVAAVAEVAEEKPHVCRYDRYVCECGAEDTGFSGSYDELERRLEAEIGARYRQQVAGLVAEVARLQDEIAERLSGGSDGSGETDHGDGTQTPGETADSDVCAGCGGPGAPAWLLQPNGVRGEHVVCDRCLETARRKHPEVVFSREKLCGIPA